MKAFQYNFLKYTGQEGLIYIYIYIYAILIAIEIHDHRNRWEATNCQVYQARYMKKCQNLKFDDKTLDC